jgi:pSer/pThr/pTyr-binding forkhead associated (FHA) protein
MADLITFEDGKNGVRFPLNGDMIGIGRGADNDIVIDDELVSKAHAVIERQKLESGDDLYCYMLRDLGSTNGTFVNGEAVQQATLWNGDLIRLGMRFFTFSDETQDEQAFSQTMELRKSWIPGVYYTKKKD